MRVRRSPHLVLYWRNGTFVVRNYATSAMAEATPFICRLLDCCAEWTTVDDIRAAMGIDRISTAAAIDSSVCGPVFPPAGRPTDRPPRTCHAGARPMEPGSRLLPYGDETRPLLVAAGGSSPLAGTRRRSHARRRSNRIAAPPESSCHPSAAGNLRPLPGNDERGVASRRRQSPWTSWLPSSD